VIRRRRRRRMRRMRRGRRRRRIRRRRRRRSILGVAFPESGEGEGGGGEECWEWHFQREEEEVVVVVAVVVVAYLYMMTVEEEEEEHGDANVEIASKSKVDCNYCHSTTEITLSHSLPIAFTYNGPQHRRQDSWLLHWHTRQSQDAACRARRYGSRPGERRPSPCFD
jgi:hypothetical protein